jgi:putative oxidoreductase
MPEPAARSRARKVAEWGLRLFLALVFVYAGVQKFPSAPGAMWVKVFADIGLGQWFRYFTGVVEVVGGALLLVPAATILAVPLLACTMVGAIIVHVLVVGTGPQTVAVSILLTGLLAIWVMRRAGADLGRPSRQAALQN